MVALQAVQVAQEDGKLDETQNNLPDVFKSVVL